MRPIAFDLSRLFIGAAGPTPRGIDRIDRGYAARLLAGDGTPNVGLLPSFARMNVMPAAKARAMLGIVEGHWGEGGAADGDARFRVLAARLRGEPPLAHVPAGPPRPRPLAATALRYGRMLRQVAWSPLRGARRAVPRGALYVNIGQVLLGWPWFFDWLDARPDVGCVFMMHDVIPLLFPEYSGPVLTRHHARAVATVARRATAMIATSHASADDLRGALARLGRTDLPIHVVPLPIDDSLLAARVGPALDSDRPYIVSVSILDQRKNHRLLLHVWRDMVRAGVRDIPTLVVVGSRGLRTTELHELIRRSPGLSDHVVVVSGLSSPGLRELMRGARAVLMPSFTEGFGLPVVEALALGTPVIASDIAAHREVAGPLATYLDPLDGPAWRNEVLARAREGDEALAARRATLSGYAPQTWRSYFDAVTPVLEAL